MAFDGPYPTHSDSMERVIHNALFPPDYEDLDDILSASASIHKVNFKFPHYIRTWLRSRPILRRLRSFKNQAENRSVTSSSSLSLLSGTADNILDRLPQGDSTAGRLIQSIQNAERCFAPLAADGDDSTNETACTNPCGSSISSPGHEVTQSARVPSTKSPYRIRGLSMGIGMHSRRRYREKIALRFKERYLEVHDGVWDSVTGSFIPNAWPAPGFGVKTAISKSRISRRTK
ncbi:hypothetical protein TWF730_006029 [Orbilia blumenaviensis]|uniref:Uncharacterized protein n=1 Tax=Orbilia blumenaviensis TaxID=1796055 RepID=A0AAV9VME4_9PEZI